MQNFLAKWRLLAMDVAKCVERKKASRNVERKSEKYKIK